MVRALTERGFTGIASLMGEVRYKDAAVAVVQRFIDNQGDAFQWSLEQVGRLIDDKAVTEGDHCFKLFRFLLARSSASSFAMFRTPFVKKSLASRLN